MKFKPRGVACAMILSVILTFCHIGHAQDSPRHKMTASEAFASLPLSVMDMIDKSRRLDMLDYYAADSIAKVPNTMEGLSYLEKVTPDYLRVCLTPVSSMTIKILPSKHDGIIMIAYTVGGKDQAYDTDLRFFDMSFNELKRDKLIKQPSLDQFFAFLNKDIREEVSGVIPFPTIRYIPDITGNGMTAELTVGHFLSREDRNLVSKYAKPSGLRYAWNGSKFNLEK